MAYRRSYKSKKYKRSRRRNKQPNTWGRVSRMASDGFFLAKKLARLVNVEHKYHEINVSGTTADTAGTIIPINCNNTAYPSNAISQGDGEHQRNGSSIKPLSYTLKGNMWTQTGLLAGARLRFIIFKHEHSNNQTIFPTSFLDTNSVNAFKNWDNRFQFKTLYDKTMSLNANSNEIRSFNIHLKLTGHTQYQGDSDLIEGGALYILVITDTPTAINYGFRSRLTYVDN